MTKPIPAGYHTLTPSIIVSDAVEAIEFYKKALGAQEQDRFEGPGGEIMHATIKIGDSLLMLSEENPTWNTQSPKTLGGTPSGIFVYVENVDQAFEKAVKAGAQVIMPVMNQFWGDRMGAFFDPYGHKWNIATHVQDLTNEEIQRRGQEFMKEMATAKK
jgi:PhnB protein